jgi:hypothetical protein
MKPGSKPESNGSKKIQLIMKDSGTVLWEADTLPLTHSHLTMTYQEVVILLKGQSLTISIQCVPNTMPGKHLEALNNTSTGSEVSQALRDFYDAITDPGESTELDNL